MSKTWFGMLVDYCAKNDLNEGLNALDKAPFLADVPLESKVNVVADPYEENGWKLLKAMTCWNRRYRRRLHGSHNWVVHLFAGPSKDDQLQTLNKGDQVLVEVDIRQSAALDMTQGPIWELLSWAARKGRISAILAGPPCRTFSVDKEFPIRV